jgi:hypothetical protein
VGSAAHAAAAIQATALQEPPTRAYRPDLDTSDRMRSAPIDWQFSSKCAEAVKVSLLSAWLVLLQQSERTHADNAHQLNTDMIQEP